MIIMEAILSASAPLHGRAAQSVGRSVVRTFKRWQAAYTAWLRERRAMAELLSMSDRDLRDIGIDRCEIDRAMEAGDVIRFVVTLDADYGGMFRFSGSGAIDGVEVIRGRFYLALSS